MVIFVNKFYNGGQLLINFRPMSRRFLRLGAIAVIVVIVAGVTGIFWKRHDIKRSFERATLPEAAPYHEATVSRLPVSQSAPTTAPLPTKVAAPQAGLPAEINLAVPFTVQAPHANWEAPYKEFCEEASVLMAIRYLQNQPIPSAEAADAALLEIKDFEESRFGYYEDTTAAQTAIVMREHFKRDDVVLVENPSVTDIKQALADGKLVIMPVAGQQLGNPYFRAPGPLYHMLVIKGYTTQGKFITNDPGTRRGADYIYEENVLMNAMHDWRTDGRVDQGRKVVLVVG